MNDDWNPTIRTPDGDEVEIPDDYNDPPHQRKDVLQSLLADGYTTREMAAELGVSETTVRNQVKNHDLELSGRWSDERKYADALDAGGEDKPDPVDEADTQLQFECPDCGIEYLTEASQYTCMREHARSHADALQRAADNGFEVLPI